MSSEARSAARILLVGLEAANFGEFNQLAAAGRIPYLHALRERGVAGRVRVPPPRSRAAVWTTLLTGVRAHRHGVLHDHQPRDDGLGVVPVTSTRCEAPRLGDLLCRAGFHVHQIGCAASHPAPALNGIVVSDRFALNAPGEALRASAGRPWVHPPEAAKEVFSRRVGPEQIDDVAAGGLVPREVQTLPGGARLHQACQVFLAETETLFRAAELCLDVRPWDVTLVALPVLARCQEIAPHILAAPGGATINDRLRVGGYEHLDMLVGQLIQKAGDDAAVMLLGSGAVEPFVVMAGMKGIGDSLPANANVLDVAPTVLALLDQPTDDAMEGRSWIEPFGNPANAKRTSSSPAQGVSPPTGASSSKQRADPAVAHLVALGYSDPLEDAAREHAEQVERETKRNRALSLIDAGEVDAAIDLLQKLMRETPEWMSVGELLAELHLARGDLKGAEARLQANVEQGLESSKMYLLLARIAMARRDMKSAGVHLHVAERIRPTLAGLQLARGIWLLRQKMYDEAADAFRMSLTADGPTAAAEDGLATCALAAGQLDAAVDHALRALDRDPQMASAHYHLGLVLVRMSRQADAVEAFQRAAQVQESRAAPYYWMARLADGEEERDALRRRGLEVLRAEGRGLRVEG